jgi:hypothetical protein
MLIPFLDESETSTHSPVTSTLKMVAECISEMSATFTRPRSVKTQKENYNREI